MPHSARWGDGEYLAAGNHEVIRVARVPDLGKSCVEGGLQDGSWVIGAQLKPGTEPGMLIVGCVVGELNAQMPASRKADDQHGLVDARPFHGPHWPTPQSGLKAPSQLVPPVRAREDVHVVTESDHDQPDPFCRAGSYPASTAAIASSTRPASRSLMPRSALVPGFMARASGSRWLQVPIEECGNPGSGVARCLFVVAHPGQRPAEQADDREYPGQRRILTRRACERGQLAGMVVDEGVTGAWVDLHVIVDAVAVQDSLQPGRASPTDRSRAP